MLAVESTVFYSKKVTLSPFPPKVPNPNLIAISNGVCEVSNSCLAACSLVTSDERDQIV